MRSITRSAAMLVVFGALLPWTPETHAQFTQQGEKLVGTGAVNLTNGAFQGFSVSMSFDGNTAIVGGYADSGDVGAAWMYTRTGGVWSQQGEKLVGTGAVGRARQGVSVALSSDGKTAIVGGYTDNNVTGAAWVYTRIGDVWSQQGEKLVGTGAVGSARQGVSVSLSWDGNTAIVGGDRDSSEVGAAWVFTRSGNLWSQQGAKLVGADAVGNARQGASVSLSADGNTAIIGGLLDNGFEGAAWVYTRTNGVWAQQGNKLVGSGAIGASGQGNAVSLSSDGNTAIIGGVADNLTTGAAWIFTRTGSLWSQQGNKLVGTAGGAEQGRSVSISSDGNTAIVGGFADSNSAGAAWIFTRTGDAWSQTGGKLVGTGAVGAAEQGVSVCIASDGNTAIVGGFSDDSSAGAAWVYARDLTDVRDPGGEVPSRFELAQNYPNPFNPTTSIEYTLAGVRGQESGVSVVRLAVYDIVGREVATLLDEAKSPGRYTVQFDGTGLASGVYFYRLQTSGFVASRKLLLQK